LFAELIIEEYEIISFDYSGDMWFDGDNNSNLTPYFSDRRSFKFKITYVDRRGRKCYWLFN
jgi:hypothetical protein